MFVVGADGINARRITPWGNTYSAVLSPDSRWIAYATNRGPQNLYVVHPDGSAIHAIATSDDGFFSFGPAWSPDSKKLLFVRCKTDFDSADLWTANVDGSGPVQLTHFAGTYNSYSWVASPRTGS